MQCTEKIIITGSGPPWGWQQGSQGSHAPCLQTRSFEPFAVYDYIRGMALWWTRHRQVSRKDSSGCWVKLRILVFLLRTPGSSRGGNGSARRTMVSESGTSTWDQTIPCDTPLHAQYGQPGLQLAQSSFKLQRFLCSKGYAMDNLDETQGIHPSLKLHTYLPGLQLKGGVRQSPLARRPPPQLTGPQNPTETDPRASEVTQTRKSAKNENGIFGISASRGCLSIEPFSQPPPPQFCGLY